MSTAQVMTARKFATGLFAGVVALSLMMPAQMAFADVYVGDAQVTEDAASGDGSEGGTWSYAFDSQEMTLVDYVGEAIRAVDQDLNILLEGDNTVYEDESITYYNVGISVENGSLTVTGDDSVYGKDKPSLTFKGKEGSDYSTAGISARQGLSYAMAEDDPVTQDSGKKIDVTIKDANIYIDGTNGGVESVNGNLTIENSGVYRGENNERLFVGAIDYNDDSSVVVLKGSEIEATNVMSTGTLTIDNTNLTVTPSAEAKDEMASDPNYVWIKDAVFATKGIEVIGEDQPWEVKPWPEEGEAYRYYLYTGSDDKVELKATETPAYYGPASKGMPKTGDSTMALALGAGTALVLTAAAAAFALRRRNEER